MLNVRSLLLPVLCWFTILFSNYAVSAHVFPPSPNPLALAAKDLLGIESATAEDILLLAHQRDTRAMALAAAGYTKGIGGFPKDPFVAESWNFLTSRHANVKGAFVTSLMWSVEQGVPYQHLGTRLFQCSMVQEAEIAQVFDKTGLFLIEEHCLELEKKKDSTPDWQREYDSVAAETEKLILLQRRAIEVIRKHILTQMSAEEEQEFQNNVSWLPIGDVIFYATTTHDPETEAPVWHMDKAVTLLDICRGERGSTTVSEMHLRSIMLEEVAVALLDGVAGQQSEQQERVRQLIREVHYAGQSEYKFHQGVQAMRVLETLYRGGAPAFLKDSGLADAWLVSAAVDLDLESMTQLAVRNFIEGNMIDARFWSKGVASMSRDQESPEISLALKIMDLANSLLSKKIEPEDSARLDMLFKEINFRKEGKSSQITQ